jgi:heme/copper-type cytochrome/quinol oxidase subunit 2
MAHTTNKGELYMDGDYPLLNLFWTMLMFMFMVMWFWIVISVFSDNFRRNDHGGWAKAGWTLFIVFLPVIGILAYMIARPKMTEQDQQIIAAMQEQQRRMSGFSSADEIAKAQELLSSGAIDQAEFDRLKARALA